MPEDQSPPQQVRVSYRKQVSDGNFGTEAAECHLEYWADTDEDAEVVNSIAVDMLADASRIVHERLGQSLSARVRQAVQPPAPAAISEPEDEGDEVPF